LIVYIDKLQAIAKRLGSFKNILQLIKNIYTPLAFIEIGLNEKDEMAGHTKLINHNKFERYSCCTESVCNGTKKPALLQA